MTFLGPPFRLLYWHPHQFIESNFIFFLHNLVRFLFNERPKDALCRHACFECEKLNAPLRAEDLAVDLYDRF
jgi:hypothetical protein